MSKTVCSSPTRRVSRSAAGVVFLAVVCLATTGHSQSSESAAEALRDPQAFAAISDAAERSRALFVEAGKVLLHPRCVNCHPSGDSPLQGMESRRHDPPVFRGNDDRGIAVMQCQSCHQLSNIDLAWLPGAAGWHLAPRSMAWQGLSLAAICRQLKDPEQNGGRDLDDIIEHVALDELVGWGWQPGPGRQPAPGDQRTFAALMATWVDSGAECPKESAATATGEAP